MEDARYRTRHLVGNEFATSASNLVSGSAGDVLFTYIVRHQAIELCVFGMDADTAIGAIAAGNEATIGLYYLPKESATASTALGVELKVPNAGMPARSGVAMDVNTQTDVNKPNSRKILYRGDRLQIKLVDPGATTAQSVRPWVQFREYKYGLGVQEGPS